MGKLVHGGKVYARVNNGIGSVLAGTYIPSSTTGSDGQIYLRNLSIPSGVDIRASISNSAIGDYFDTGYLFNENTRIEAKFKIPSSVSSYNTPFGCRISTSTGNEPHQLFFTLNNTSLYFAFGGTQSLTNDFFTYNSDAVVEMLGSVLKMQQNSNIKYAKAEPYSTSGTKNLYLFCANADGSPWSTSYCVMTLYYFKIYEGDDLVHYFLPCVDGNSEPCLYDAITGDYLYNQGTGALTVGNSLSANNEIIKSYAKVGGDWNDLIGTSVDALTDVDIIAPIPIGDLRFSTWDSLKKIESTSCMTLGATDTTLTSTYIGGVIIGCNFTIPVDVSSIDTIQGTVDIGTGYSLTQFPFYAALCEQYPNNTAGNPSSWSPVVIDTTNVANSTYNFSLDTSNLSGGYFLVFVLTGMNATIRDIQAITGG